MHSYLRSIGFSKFNKKDVEKLIKAILIKPTIMGKAKSVDGSTLYEIRRNFGEDIGIAIVGDYDEDNKFETEYYYPYFNGSGITTEEIVEVERHLEREAFAGVCDDVKVGVSIIFYLKNFLKYYDKISKRNSPKFDAKTTLSGLSLSAKILLPINKNKKQIENVKKSTINRNHLIAAARQGDEDAIESLTLEDIDTYTVISRRIQNEDVFSLVDTFFMPYGIESDQYSLMGEILNVETITNSLTKEEIYKITIDCSDLVFDVCINKMDLLGEPDIGRRFKGIVWLQGEIQETDKYID